MFKKILNIRFTTSYYFSRKFLNKYQAVEKIINMTSLVDYFENVSSNKDEENISAILKGNFWNLKIYKQMLSFLKKFKSLDLTDNKVTLKTLFEDLEYK